MWLSGINRMAGKTGWLGLAGAWMQRPEIAIPADTKQAFLTYSKPARIRWGREALKILTYIVTGRWESLEGRRKTHVNGGWQYT